MNLDGHNLAPNTHLNERLTTLSEGLYFEPIQHWYSMKVSRLPEGP